MSRKKYESKFVGYFTSNGEREEHYTYAKSGAEARRDFYQFEMDADDPTFMFTGVIVRAHNVE